MNQNRVVGEGIAGVDEPVEQLVVPGRRQRQLAALGLLLRTAVPRPVGFEVQQRAVAVAQGHVSTLTPAPEATDAPLRRTGNMVPASPVEWSQKEST